MFNQLNEQLNVGGIEVHRLPKNDKEIIDLSAMLAQKLAEVLPTEQDVWWFVVEQYDRALTYNQRVKHLLAHLPVHLYEIEHEGRRSENSYVGKSNPGIVFLDCKVRPFFEKHFDKDMAELIQDMIFVNYCNAIKDALAAIRLKYAVHFHNNCISSHSYSYADQWNEVIQSLAGD